MTADLCCSGDCDLLEEQTIASDDGIWVNDDTVGVGHHEAYANLAVEWNVSPSDDRPKSMLEDMPFA